MFAREEVSSKELAPSLCASPRVSALVLICLFLVSVIIRFLLADYSKHYLFYLDEQIYGSYAQSLLDSGTLEVLGLPMGFFRPIYSLLISPAYLLSDPFAQQKAVAFINAAVVSTGIFPVYLLAKQLLQRNEYALAGALFYICSSDLVYSQTYMTETAALPLMLWAVYAFWKLENSEYAGKPRHDIPLGLLFGVLMGLCFMCKGGAALVLPIAYFAYLVIHLIMQVRKSKAITFIKHAAVSLIAAALGFAVVYALFHFFIPPTSGDTADASTKLAGLDESVDYMFTYYGVFYYLFAALIGFSFFPFAVTFLNRKHMEEDEARLFDFLIVSLLVMAVIVAVTITLRENYLESAPRAHMRYIAYLYVPLILIFIRELRRKRTYSLRLVLTLTLAFVAALFLYLFMYGGRIVPKGELCDDTILKVFSGFPEYQLISVPVFALVLIVGALLLVKKRKVFAVGIFCILFVFNIANGVIASWIFRSGSGYDDVQIGKVLEMLDIQTDNPDAKFLVIDGWKSVPYQINAANTFLDQRQTYFVDYEDYMLTYQEKGEISWEEARKTLPLLRRKDLTYQEMDHIDYIVAGYQGELILNEGEYSEKYDFPELKLTIYKLVDTVRMPATDSRLNLVNTEGKSAEQILDEALAEGKITPEQREDFERQIYEAFPEGWTPDNK